jgi:hypothetical protein
MYNLTQNDILFLLDKEQWRWGPTFGIIWVFRRDCSLEVFEAALTGDASITHHPRVTHLVQNDRPGKCIFATEKLDQAFGFRYFGLERLGHQLYYMVTYPKQYKRYCGEFWPSGQASKPDRVIRLHAELVKLIKRMSKGLPDAVTILRTEDAPWPPHSDLGERGIIVYDWIAIQGKWIIEKRLKPCYALLDPNLELVKDRDG